MALINFSEKDMADKEKYRRLSNYRVKKIMRYFGNDLTGNTINRSFTEFRVKISKSSIEELSKEFGVFKLDESYLEVCRIL